MSKADDGILLLEKAVTQYDKIFLFDKEELISKLLNVKIVPAVHKKILVLSSKRMISDVEDITIQNITEQEKEQIIDLYFTYEFSDKFLFISRKNINYGGIFHFVDAGILNMEEAFEALIM